MRIECQIMDPSDIIQETKAVFGTGEQRTSGKINLLTFHPTSTTEVKISPEMWDGGKAGELLKGIVGKRVHLDVEYKEFSFANDEGKHVSLKGFHLFALPNADK